MGQSFLQPDIDQIRHQIRGILDSYSHDWDILAELAQNAVDAINRKSPTRGHIRITINAVDKTIEMADNGTGIAPDALRRLLRPFGTDKFGRSDQVGQKGVGLTFILFSSVRFEVVTHHETGSARAVIEGASTWLQSDSDTELLIDVTDVPAEGTGVQIKVKMANTDHPIFDQAFPELVFALRTRTALGDTKYIWGDALNCDFELTHIDKSGNKKAIDRDCQYLLPTEGLKGQDQISIDDYLEWRSESDRSDSEKRKKLKDKIIFRSGKKYQAGRDIKYWACFVPNRSVWQRLSEIHNLSLEDPLSDELYDSYIFSGGLHTSSKGMPTGISLELKPRGSAGYVPNFFIVIEDPSLSFDIGRKAIQTRQQGMLREVAYEQFRDFINTVVKYISGSIDEPDPTYDREELFAEIRELPDLGSSMTKFIKRPDNQEATVAGLFFESMGGGLFEGFEPYISGYKGRYDLYGRIDKKSFVIEFKYDLLGLFRDFSDERKMFDEVDLVVVWEITERDRKTASNRGLTITPVESGVLAADRTRFPHAHFRMNIDGVNAVEILCMKKIIQPSE
jgi:molecular chaperone HtpG